MRCLCLSLLAYVTLSSYVWPATAAEPSPHPLVRPPEKESQYAADLLAYKPALAERFQEATRAMDDDRLSEAREGFTAVLAESPRHAPSLRRLSYVEGKLSHPVEALRLARSALAVAPDDADNLYAMSKALGEQADLPSRQEAVRYALRMLAKEPGREAAAVLAQSALAANDRGALDQAAEALRRYAADDSGTYVMTAIQRLFHEDWSGADRELAKAAELGLPADRVERLREDFGINEHKRHWLYAEIAGGIFAAWLGGLLLIFIAGLGMSRMTLQAIDRHAGQPAVLASKTRTLRKGYAAAIGFAALYYYLSIPILIIVTLGGAAAILYGFLLVGHIPIKLLAVVGIGAVLTIWAVLKSLFVRRGQPVDPGRRLDESEAPQLWALLREVAERVGTRPVDKVFVTAGTDLAVTERGGLSQRLRDKGERLLILGLATLGGLSVRELRAILAHEYGHFSNRDTAGGGMALTVNASLLSTVIMLARSGVSALNPTWQYLRIYSALFARVTRGASRLQEVLADQFAALAYGAHAFCRGLENVVRRSVEFDGEVSRLVQQVERERRPIPNLYQPPAMEPSQAQEGQHAVEKALSAPASAYDTHPPPRRRMELVMRLPPMPEDMSADGPAWSLFADRPALEAAMTKLANDDLRERGVLDEEPAPAGFASPLEL